MWPSCCVLALLWAVLPSMRAEVLAPPYFNIAGNRKVEASSTCGVGVEGQELYCKLVGASQDYRDSDNTLIDGQNFSVKEACNDNVGDDMRRGVHNGEHDSLLFILKGDKNI
uniref:Laminin N-terminal domain-containing protein n=1 Tax=Rhodnius prolixus TaxID=13249 RepID=T1HUR5_RHOPR